MSNEWKSGEPVGERRYPEGSRDSLGAERPGEELIEEKDGITISKQEFIEGDEDETKTTIILINPKSSFEEKLELDIFPDLEIFVFVGDKGFNLPLDRLKRAVLLAEENAPMVPPKS